MPISEDKALYPPLDPVQVGLKGKCPQCGQGRMFGGILKFKDHCANCGLDYSKMEVGDGAAIFVIMIANAVVLGGALGFESAFNPPLWLHFVIWPCVAIGLCVYLTRLFKGVLLALQYSKKAEQGMLDDKDDHS